MTQAQRIAELFGNDGHAWTTSDGQSLDEVCETEADLQIYRDGHGTDTYKYIFPDESVIMVAGAAWDFGYPDCWCWGLGHDEDCQQRQHHKVSYQALEDNGGGLHLAVLEGDSCTHFMSDFELSDGSLRDTVADLLSGRSPWSYDGLAEDPQAEYSLLTSAAYGCQIVADQNGVYPDRMGAAAKRELLVETNVYRACYWLANDKQSDVVLTCPEQSHLSDDRLYEIAERNAREVKLNLDAGTLHIGEWTRR